MEQKKTLWIIASVGIFLLVILGAGLFIYSPSRSTQNASITPVAKSSQNGWTNTQNPIVQNTQEYPVNTNSQTVNDMFVVSENTTVLGFNENQAQTSVPTDLSVQNQNAGTTIDLNALKRELLAEQTTVVPTVTTPQNINITVNIPDTEKQDIVSVQSPVNVNSEFYSTTVSQPVSQIEEINNEIKAPVKSNRKSEKQSKKEVRETKEAKPVQKVVEKPAAPKEITRYWVQVASYENKKTAENAKETLSDKRISSDIYTYKDNKDKLFYRVRVGPFTTNSEAEYWKAKIEELPAFKKAGSYITQTKN